MKTAKSVLDKLHAAVRAMCSDFPESYWYWRELDQHRFYPQNTTTLVFDEQAPAKRPQPSDPLRATEPSDLPDT